MITRADFVYITFTLLMQVRALALVGDAASALRAFVILSLFLVCGRSSEVAWMTFDAMTWCFTFLCVFSSLPQSKVSEVKLTCFVSGTCRHDDWFLLLGDYLTMHPPRPSLWSFSPGHYYGLL